MLSILTKKTDVDSTVFKSLFKNSAQIFTEKQKNFVWPFESRITIGNLLSVTIESLISHNKYLTPKKRWSEQAQKNAAYVIATLFQARLQEHTSIIHGC